MLSFNKLQKDVLHKNMAANQERELGGIQKARNLAKERGDICEVALQNNQFILEQERDIQEGHLQERKKKIMKSNSSCVWVYLEHPGLSELQEGVRAIGT